MKTHRYFVYILGNSSRSVLYTGVTNSLRRRVGEHTAAAAARMTKTFCGRYNCRHLVYYEEFQWILDAISREKQIKKYSRDKKLALIRSINPRLNELDIPWEMKAAGLNGSPHLLQIPCVISNARQGAGFEETTRPSVVIDP